MKQRIDWYGLFIGFALVILSIIILLIVSGCAGTGFEKETTLMPDSMSANFMQEYYRGDSAAWRGAGISFTWEFK